MRRTCDIGVEGARMKDVEVVVSDVPGAVIYKNAPAMLGLKTL